MIMQEERKKSQGQSVRDGFDWGGGKRQRKLEIKQKLLARWGSDPKREGKWREVKRSRVG